MTDDFRPVPHRLKAMMRQFLVHGLLYVRARPKLSKAMLAIIDHLPALKRRMKRIANAKPKSASNVRITLDYLTPQARRIYADLKVAIEKNKEAR